MCISVVMNNPNMSPSYTVDSEIKVTKNAVAKTDTDTCACAIAIPD